MEFFRPRSPRKRVRMGFLVRASWLIPSLTYPPGDVTETERASMSMTMGSPLQ